MSSHVLRTLLMDEVRQRLEEGCDVGPLGRAVQAAGDDTERLLEAYAELTALQPAADFPFHEPTDLEGIRAARPPATEGAALPPEIGPPLPAEELSDRVLGGWLGRCAGLVLGKPLETAPFMEHLESIRRYLEAAGAYPLSDYVPQSPAACAAVGRGPLPCPACHRGQVAGVETDDDVRYTIAGLAVLEQHGAAFTTADVARWWLHNLPAAQVFTAEEAAYRNVLLMRAQFEPEKLAPEDWHIVRTWLNPYREWIGAQIRADGWALACLGRPRLAAEFAWRDATLSHVKNGVYGAMFCAAMIAAAPACRTAAEIVRAGLAQIPATSRLADAVERTITTCQPRAGVLPPLEEVLAWLWEEFGDYHCVHTINNAAAVVAALLLGNGDFERTIAAAVMAGWDTDCNGATAGCISGVFAGARRLPEKWSAPLRDTLRAALPGYDPIAISACARRHVAVAQALSGTVTSGANEPSAVQG